MTNCISLMRGTRKLSDFDINTRPLSITAEVLRLKVHFPFWPHDLNLGPEPRLRDPTLHF